MKECCATCRYFQPGISSCVGFTTTRPSGECRVTAPAIPYNGFRSRGMRSWPIVWPEDWCGNWLIQNEKRASTEDICD